MKVIPVDMDESSPNGSLRQNLFGAGFPNPCLAISRFSEPAIAVLYLGHHSASLS